MGSEAPHSHPLAGGASGSWRQSHETVDVVVPVPAGTRARDVRCDVSATSALVGLRGQPALLEGELGGRVKVDETLWTLEDGEVNVRLQKMEPGQAWAALLQGHPLPLLDLELDRKRLLLERYQLEHPGFDFSGAEVSGSLPRERGAER